MSSRMFQGVVLQMKDSVNRMVGVIDSDGYVVACSELTSIGEHWTGAVEAVNHAENGVAYFEGKTLRPLAGWGSQFDYAAFVKGDDDVAASLCAMAVVAFNGAKAYYEEKHDKATFVKNIISDNILLGDIYTQAKELHFLSEAPRAAFLVRQLGPADAGIIDGNLGAEGFAHLGIPLDDALIGADGGGAHPIAGLTKAKLDGAKLQVGELPVLHFKIGDDRLQHAMVGQEPCGVITGAAAIDFVEGSIGGDAIFLIHIFRLHRYAFVMEHKIAQGIEDGAVFIDF